MNYLFVGGPLDGEMKHVADDAPAFVVAIRDDPLRTPCPWDVMLGIEQKIPTKKYQRAFFGCSGFGLIYYQYEDIHPRLCFDKLVTYATKHECH